ncbi:Succinyl-diaminopimelate desuccinylase [Asticcacaulis sp. MM231]|uniref:M20/M25/M40 family metallo-hydrolase n=1 Tax=Asticcacaulis sp. MM231 TaxID=3157666 RepID=UPI0032D586C4
MRLKALLLALTSLMALSGQAVAADRSGDGEPAFRALFKELVETNTAPGVGSCTLAAQRMEARLKAAGYSDTDIHLFIHDSAPNDGGLVATLKGSGSTKKPILLLAHIDVVAAKREDWTRDPFILFEEDGQFYGRGVADDKGQAAIFTDLLIRYKQEGYRPKRDIKLALTCGEETEGVFNGAKWLSEHHKDWIDAAFAINEGAYGADDAEGQHVSFDVEAAEKVYQDFTLETDNPGGHSSRPVPENAIYDMADALKAVSAYRFPVRINDATREYFTRMADIKGGEDGAAMRAIVANPHDAAAEARLSQDAMWQAMLRTTCVATMIEGGHAVNALPQTVKANVNCRIFPGTQVDEVQAALATAINNPKVSLTLNGAPSPATPAPPLGRDILAPIEKVVAEVYPGVPVLPTMETGASDGIYTTAAGIPTYGFYGFFEGPDEGNIHGLNEHVGVKSLMEGRRFFHKLVKLYADQ